MINRKELVMADRAGTKKISEKEKKEEEKEEGKKKKIRHESELIATNGMLLHIRQVTVSSL